MKPLTREQCILTALQGLLASGEARPKNSGSITVFPSPEAVADMSLSYGDAMWRRLEQEKDERLCRVYEDPVSREIQFTADFALFGRDPTEEDRTKFNQYADMFVANHRAKFPKEGAR